VRRIIGRLLPGVVLFMVMMVAPALAVSAEEVAVYGYNSDPIVFWDPRDAASDETIWMNNVYERLLHLNFETGDLEPELAMRYEVSDDGLVWTFYLRQDVQFHTGNAMDAAAVRDSILGTKNRGKGLAYIWDAVKSVDVIDGHTVTFRLEYPAPLGLSAASALGAFIYDPKYVDEAWYSAGNDSGTGPYAVKSHDGTERIELAKFTKYWRGWDGQHFDKVVFLKVADATTRRLMVESGQIDFTNQLPPQMIADLGRSSSVEIVKGPSFQNLIAFFNTKKPPLDDPLVRRALAYTIPYADVITSALGGFGQQSRGPVPYGMWGHSDRIKQYTFSMETARALLTAAGYPDGGFKLVLTYTAGDDIEELTAQLWKSALAQLNVELEIRGMPWESHWDYAKGTDPLKRQDIFMFYWWSSYPNPYGYLHYMFETEQEITWNLGYYSNPVYDSLINTANRLTGRNQDEAIDMFIEAQNILMEDVPGLAVFDMQYVRAKNADLTGYVDNPIYTNVVFWYDCHRK